MLDSSGSDLLSDCSYAPSDYEPKDVAPVAAELFLQRRERHSRSAFRAVETFR